MTTTVAPLPNRMPVANERVPSSSSSSSSSSPVSDARPAPRDVEINGDGFESSSNTNARMRTRALLGDAAPAPMSGAQDTSATDDVVERVFQDMLGRSAGTNGFWHEFAAEKASEGMPLEQIESEVRMHVKASGEYEALHATDVLVDNAFTELLGRDSGGAGFWHEFAKQKQSEGMSLEDIDREVRTHLQASEEYQALHPAPVKGRAEDSFVRQPNGWTCGPTSLTMALAHHGLGEATPGRASSIAAETGTGPAAGFPGGVALMASEARERGLQATHSSSTDVNAMRSELENGRSLIVNGTHPSGVPHFIYVAGVEPDGRFIVNDPASGGTQRWSAAELHAFTHRGNNPPGYAAVWK